MCNALNIYVEGIESVFKWKCIMLLEINSGIVGLKKIRAHWHSRWFPVQGWVDKAMFCKIYWTMLKQELDGRWKLWEPLFVGSMEY